MSQQRTIIGLCPQCRRPYALARRVCPRDGARLRPPSDEVLTKGSMVGERFVVVEELGHGGMAQVFRAYDTKTRAMRALKVLHPELARRQGLIERFFEEARALHRVRHPVLVRMHGSGQTAEGHLYLVLEHVQGRPLSEFILPRPLLPLRTLLDLAAQALRGLAAAHDAGVVHRDFKAENILVVREPHKDPVARVVDFGIACAVDARRERAQELSGTPAAMSPEQIRGKPVGPASDVYSAGILLFELLARRHPFEAGNAAAMMNAQVYTPAPELAPLVRNKRVPVELMALIDRCLRKDAAARPQSLAPLIEAVDAARDAQPRFHDPAAELHTGPTLLVKGESSQRTLQDWHLGDSPTLVEGWDLCPSCDRLLDAGSTCEACEAPSMPAPAAQLPEARAESLASLVTGVRGAALGVIRLEGMAEAQLHQLREVHQHLFDALKEAVEEQGLVLSDRGDELRIARMAARGASGMAALDASEQAGRVLAHQVRFFMGALRAVLAGWPGVNLRGAVAYGPVVWAGFDALDADQVVRGSPPDLATRLVAMAKPWELLTPQAIAKRSLSHERIRVRETLRPFKLVRERVAAIERKRPRLRAQVVEAAGAPPVRSPAPPEQLPALGRLEPGRVVPTRFTWEEAGTERITANF